MTWRVALIGCGKIGSEFADDPRVRDIYTHAGAWCACPGAELAAVCDVDAARARRCADRHSVSAHFDDVAAMLAEVRPDIVSVCTPDETHASILRGILESTHTRAVLMEKPLALDLGEARDLIAMAERNGILLAVNYSRRYSVAHRALAERLRAGELGRVQCVSGYYTKGLLHNGTHWLDLARMLVGEIATITAFDRLREASADPTLDVRLEFTNGATASLHGLDARAYSLFEMDIVGTEGRARIVDSGHRVELSAAGDSPFYSGYRTLLEKESRTGGMQDVLLHAAQDLVDALNTGHTPLCTGADAVAALAAAFAARASVRHGNRTQRPQHVAP